MYNSSDSNEGDNTPLDLIGGSERLAPRKERQNILKNPYVISGMVGFNAFWGFQIYKRINKLLSLNCSNEIYQIRRPNSIANRLSSFKIFVIPTSLILLASGYLFSNSRRIRESSKNRERVGVINERMAAVSSDLGHKLEHFTSNFKEAIPRDNFRNMGLDLKRDMNKLKGFFSNIF